MRQNVTVYGVGERKKGVGKRTGKAYDFTEVSIGYVSPEFNGYKCETVAIDAAVIGDRSIVPGDVLDVVFHSANYKTYVDAIL